MPPATCTASSRVGSRTSACVCGVGRVAPLDQRQGKGRRLAGARLRLPDQIAPGQQQGDGPRLDRRRRFKPEVGNGAGQRLGQVQIGKGGQLGLFLGGDRDNFGFNQGPAMAGFARFGVGALAFGLGWAFGLGRTVGLARAAGFAVDFGFAAEAGGQVKGFFSRPARRPP